VRAIRLEANDQVIGMDIFRPDAFLLVVTAGGYGKLTPIKNYPRQHRAGAGVRTFRLTEKTGEVAASRAVTQSQQLMIISAQGIITRTPVKEKDPKKGITVQGNVSHFPSWFVDLSGVSKYWGGLTDFDDSASVVVTGNDFQGMDWVKHDVAATITFTDNGDSSLDSF
jgi:hypothetical protein